MENTHIIVSNFPTPESTEERCTDPCNTWRISVIERRDLCRVRNWRQRSPFFESLRHSAVCEFHLTPDIPPLYLKRYGISLADPSRVRSLPYEKLHSPTLPTKAVRPILSNHYTRTAICAASRGCLPRRVTRLVSFVPFSILPPSTVTVNATVTVTVYSVTLHRITPPPFEVR